MGNDELRWDDPRVYEMVEQRRQHWDALLWQIPLITFTGQAFIFTILLGPDTSLFGRLAAGVISALVSFASLLLLARHRQAEQVDAQWLDEYEAAAGWPAERRQHGEAWAIKRNHQRPGYQRTQRGKTGWGGVPLWNTYRTWVVGHWILIGFALAVVLAAVMAPSLFNATTPLYEAEVVVSDSSAATTQTWCLAWAPDVCAEWVATFPYWEITAVALVTVLVTVITVRASVRAARRETDRVLKADADDRAAADAASAKVREADARQDGEHRRAALARELIRATRLLEAARRDTLEAPDAAAAKAEWAALRVSFEVSGQPGAAQLYEWVDLALSQGARTGKKKLAQRKLLDSLLLFRSIEGRVAAWARDPESVRQQTAQEAAELQEEREAFVQSLIKRVGQSRPPGATTDDTLRDG